MFSAKPQQKLDVQSRPLRLTPFQQGFLLGQLEAERRAREGSTMADPRENQNIQDQMKTKRDIERRVQATLSQSDHKE